MTKLEIYAAAMMGQYIGELPTPATKLEMYMYDLAISGGGSGGGEGGDTAKWVDLHDLFVKTDSSLIYDLSGVPLKALYMVLSCDNGEAESSQIKSAVSYKPEGKLGVVQNSTMYSLWGGTNSVCYEPPLNGASKYWSDYARNADGDRTRSQSLIIPGATINEVKLTFSDSENDFKNSTIMGVLA